MSPTIPTAANVEQHKRPTLVKPQSAERRSELVCRVKYCNTLPDIPFDPKFIQYPFESTRFIQYNPTSLERNYKYEVLTEHDLGVTIDLINKDMYSADPNAVLDPADEKLLEEDILTPHDSKRSRHHSRSVSWLRRTEYISTEQTRFQPQVMDKVEAKVGFSIKRSLKEETIYMDRESQIKAIEKTYEDAKKPIERHHSKPNVVPVEILSVYPDFKMWRYPCAQVMFDSDPAPIGKTVPAQMEQMSQAMIRGVMDESGEQFVAYFLPSESTMEKRRRDFTNGIDYEDEEEYDYKIAREYNWNVKTKASKGYEENYFFVIRQDGVYYNELETRVRLSKRRQKAGTAPNNTRLVVKHRPMDANEFNIHRQREKQLQHPIEEEDEEEDEESAGEEEKNAGSKKTDDNKGSGGSGDEESGKEGSGKGDDSDKEDASGKESDKEDASGKESDKEDSSGKESDKEDASGKESDKDDASGKESDKDDASDKEDGSGKESDKEQGSTKGDKSDKGEDSDASDKDDSDKEDARSGKGGSGSDKSQGEDSDADSSASGGRSGSGSGSGSGSSHSGSDDEE